jgi:ribose transport system substrate-binding protein
MSRKNLPKLAAVLLAALLAPAAFAGPKVAVILKGRSEFWKAVEKGANEAGTKFGADVVVKAPLADTDVAVQIQLLNAVVAQGATAIVIAPINDEALKGPIAAAAAHGAKVVVIDTPITGANAPVFVGTDQEASGRAAGALLAKLVKDTDEAAILKHNQSSGATFDREHGAVAAFREVHPKTTLYTDIYAASEPGQETAKCELLLTTHPQVTAVLSSGSPGTIAMLHLLQEKKLAGTVKLIGFGFNLNPEIATAISNGALQGWIAQQPTEFGAHGVETALSLIKGETVPPVVHTDFLIITKDNLNDPKVQALLAL